jgi:ribosomal protein L11 methyltransferase
VAELDAVGFTGFWEDDGVLRAFLNVADWGEALEAEVVRILASCGARRVGAPVEVEDRNWNAVWESTVRPVVVEPFRIRASWHEPESTGSLIDVVIDPKMSFGTGHHETTRLVLRFIAEVVRPGDRVLDAGSGTGILAIAAVRTGAAHVLAFDTDHRAVENGSENVRRNEVQQAVDYRLGGIEVAAVEPYDVIMANINRTALCTMMPDLARVLAPAGTIILSGVLRTDTEPMRTAIVSAGCRIDREGTDHDWWAAVVRSSAAPVAR